MKKSQKIGLLFLGLVILISCDTTLYYHRESHFPWPHGDSDYSEIQFHDDNTYEEYCHFSNATHTDYQTNNGHFYTRGDTIIVVGNSWDFDDSDSTWYISDSTTEIQRYLMVKNKLVRSSPLSPETFNTRSLVFQKGKSRKLRRIEKKDSLDWFNDGYLRRPFNGSCLYHGLRGHNEDCKKRTSNERL